MEYFKLPIPVISQEEPHNYAIMSALLSNSGHEINISQRSNSSECMTNGGGGDDGLANLNRLASFTIPQSIQIGAPQHSRRQSSKQANTVDNTPPSSRTLSKEMIYQSKQQRKQQQEKLVQAKPRRKAKRPTKSSIQALAPPSCCTFTPNLPNTFSSDTDLNNNNTTTSSINLVMASTESSTSIADSISSSSRSSSFLPSAHNTIRPLSFLSHSLESSSSTSSMNDSSSMDQRARIDTDSFVNQNLGLDLNHSIVADNVLNVIELVAQNTTSLVSLQQTPSSSLSLTSVSAPTDPTYTINCPPEWHSRLNRMITCFILLKKLTESKARMNELLSGKKIQLKCSVCGQACSTVESLLEHKEKSDKCTNEIEMRVEDVKKTKIQQAQSSSLNKSGRKLSNFRRNIRLSSIEYLNQEESVEVAKRKKKSRLASTVRRKYNKRRFSCLNNTLTCEKCGKLVRTKAELLVHLHKHAGKGTECWECGKKCASYSNLVLHVQLHTGEKPHACQFCGRQFTQDAHLTRHLRLHTGEKPFVCNICGKNYKDYSYYQTHLRIHRGERLYKCNYCGKEYYDASYYKKHIRLHTGEKPYMCTVCGRQFHRSDYLKLHSFSHTDERPYNCHICGKGFKMNYSLKMHLKNHEESPDEYNATNEEHEFELSTMENESQETGGGQNSNMVLMMMNMENEGCEDESSDIDRYVDYTSGTENSQHTSHQYQNGLMSKSDSEQPLNLIGANNTSSFFIQDIVELKNTQSGQFLNSIKTTKPVIRMIHRTVPSSSATSQGIPIINNYMDTSQHHQGLEPPQPPLSIRLPVAMSSSTNLSHDEVVNLAAATSPSSSCIFQYIKI